MVDNVNGLNALPIGATGNNIPAHIALLKDDINGGSIIRRLTGAQIAALSAPEKVAGVVVWNTTTNKLQRYNGSAFVDAALEPANNLSDLADAAAARTNLGLGTAATTAATDYATAAQGTLATNALPKAGGTMAGDITMTNNQIINVTKLQGPTTSADLKLHVPYGGQVDVQGGAGTPATGTIAHANATFANQSATLGQIPSSREVKKDIAALTAEQAGAFDAITPVQFRYRDGMAPNEVEQQGVHLGFIAEDVKAAGVRVLEDPDGVVFGLQPFDLIAVLWAKVQELQQRLSDLEG